MRMRDLRCGQCTGLLHKLRDSRAYIDLMKSNRTEDKAVVREYLDEHLSAMPAACL